MGFGAGALASRPPTHPRTHAYDCTYSVHRQTDRHMVPTYAYTCMSCPPPHTHTTHTHHTHLAFLRTCSGRRAGKAGKTGEPDSDLRCCLPRSRRRAAGPRILLRGLLATRRLEASEHAVVLRLQALELQDKLASPARPERASVAYGLGNQGREIRDSGNACVAYNYDTHTHKHARTHTHTRRQEPTSAEWHRSCG